MLEEELCGGVRGFCAAYSKASHKIVKFTALRRIVISGAV